jgi:hypothetical protein
VMVTWPLMLLAALTNSKTYRDTTKVVIRPRLGCDELFMARPVIVSYPTRRCSLADAN